MTLSNCDCRMKAWMSLPSVRNSTPWPETKPSKSLVAQSTTECPRFISARDEGDEGLDVPHRSDRCYGDAPAHSISVVNQEACLPSANSLACLRR